MFESRPLTDDLAAVRRAHAPDAVVLDCERDFETIEPSVAEQLGLVVDRFEPFSAPDEWLSADAPEILRRYASDEFTIGLPGDGGVAWTHQTVPPAVIVKPRLESSPESFVDFLVAEALVEVDAAPAESFFAYFGERYPDLAAATPLSPADSFQLAAALYDAYVGRLTRPVFAAWGDSDGDPPLDDDSADGPHLPALHDAWADAGQRLQPRLDGLSGEVARGETDFAAAAELACAAVKHGLDLPDPFAALDTVAYERNGPAFAVRWAEKTFDALADED
ncbi:MAG: hypothetical protein ABEJ05_00105 [Haloglomus sp.]